MPTMWDANELERRTAARVAGMGFIPAVNVVHRETQSEFDVYAFMPKEGGFERLMVQCTISSPSADKLSALKAYANSFHANHAVFITATKPHRTKERLAEKVGVELLSEAKYASKHSCIISGRTLDVRAELSVRERAILQFLRGIAWLRRVAFDCRQASPEAEQVVETWNALDEVSLIPDPFQRLQQLYEIHFDEPQLSQKCAGAEGLADDPYDALWNALVLGEGSYTHSALAAQTLNRAHTLITFSECACRVAEGESVPKYLDDPRGRRGKLIRALADRRRRHAFAVVAFDFIYGWGGLWSAQEESIDGDLARLAHVTVEHVADACSRMDTLLRDEGMREFTKPFESMGATWESFALLPYFAKGIGAKRFYAEKGIRLVGRPWFAWQVASSEHEQACERYEKEH